MSEFKTHLLYHHIQNTSKNISNNYSCIHLSELRSTIGSDPFKNIQTLVQLRPPLGRASVQKDHLVKCGACLNAPPRLYACVACAEVSCQVHAPTHASESSHAIAMDVDRAELFCCICKDQVYDKGFDTEVVLAAVGVGLFTGPSSQVGENLRKRRRVDYKPWKPDLKERALILEKASPLPSQLGDDSTTSLPFGLRGLNNLGNTCFMNSVLQALLHTPPFRNYFLSDMHNRYFCQQRNNNNNTTITTTATKTKNSKTKTKAKANANANQNKFCLACDLDSMFSSVFSGDRTPYSPAKFLYSWWQHASNLASYEQQDAHEFFISILDGIHENMHKDQGKAHIQGSGECCVAHKMFSGILRSDVMCSACGFTSTTYDPCVDISLDLEPTLMGCLDRFTRPERLGSDQKFFCQKCQVRQESLKQMSITKLPLVSCFHIKRFEHSAFRKMSKKIDRYLNFPFSLNMAPYLTSSILKTRYGNRMFCFDGEETQTHENSSEFELFAVITHTGKLDAGHYVTYLRFSNQWYKCDDAWITRVSDTFVRASQGYMMFYVQKRLYYKATQGFNSRF